MIAWWFALVDVSMSSFCDDFEKKAILARDHNENNYEFHRAKNAKFELIRVNGNTLSTYGCEVKIQVASDQIDLDSLKTYGCQAPAILKGGNIIELIQSIAAQCDRKILVVDASDLSVYYWWKYGHSFYHKFGFVPHPSYAKKQNICGPELATFQFSKKYVQNIIKTKMQTEFIACQDSVWKSIFEETPDWEFKTGLQWSTLGYDLKQYSNKEKIVLPENLLERFRDKDCKRLLLTGVVGDTCVLPYGLVWNPPKTARRML